MQQTQAVTENIRTLKQMSQPKKQLPDVSHEIKAHIEETVERVGMENIEMPIRLSVDGEVFLLPAKIDAFVSLDKAEAKGIHMSRLYLTLQNKLQKPVSFEVVKEILSEFISNQKGLSNSGFVKISFTLPVNRKALKSEQTGWRQYPVFIQAEQKNNNVVLMLGGEIMYSSTCPCSAALSRQLVQEKFLNDFSDKSELSIDEVSEWLKLESSIVATPHAQRSIAKFKVEASEWLGFIELIDLVESSLGTPVQSAVKRVDEQEFARLNATNLMFCEDAGRRVKAALKTHDKIKEFAVHLSHKESLHPHDAVSMVASSEAWKERL